MIESLSLKNFKCFQEVSVPFGSLTLLSGVNSAGKSTIIQSLLVLRQSWLKQFDSLVLNGELGNLGHADDVLSEDADDLPLSIRVTGGKSTLLLSVTLPDGSDVFEIQDRPDSQESHFGLFGPCFQYLKAERLGPRTTSAMSDEHVLRRREVGSGGEYTAHFLSQYGAGPIALSTLAHPKANSRSLLSQAEAWLAEISPGVQISVAPHPEMDLMNLTFSFALEKVVRSDSYRPTNVGFGLTYVLPVIVAILAARKGDLVIIENPEAHLHPAGQARVGRLLALAAEAGVQVLTETHSDHILNGIRLAVKTGEVSPDKICLNFFARKTEGGLNRPFVVTPSVDRNGRLSEWPRGFFDEWENSLDALLN